MKIKKGDIDMAGSTGNSDFNLPTYQWTSKQELYISFKAEATGSNPMGLEVTNPANGSIFFSKDYTNLDGTSYTSEVIDVPVYGEYRVKLSTNRGYSWQTKYPWVKVYDTFTETVTITEEDVNRWKTENIIIKVTMAIAGIVSIYKWPKQILTAAIAATALDIQDVIYFDTEEENLPPRAGWKIKVTVSDKESYFEHKTEYIDKEGDIQQTIVNNGPYISWWFG